MMADLLIRKAEMPDLDRIMEIYGHAREQMRASGNPNQWGYTYPEEDLIREDIKEAYCHVICDEAIHGVFVVTDGPDETYKVIENGKWLNNEPYVVIHRIAGDGQVHGILKSAIDHCRNLSSNIRIDTHEDNAKMRHLIEKNGFIRCGIIYVRDHSQRIAYQWTAAPI